MAEKTPRFVPVGPQERPGLFCWRWELPMAGMYFGIGVLVGMAAAAVLMRYAIGLGEKMAYGAKEGVPALGRYDAPLLQETTAGGETNLEDDLEN
jgi:hypothetical protein